MKKYWLGLLTGVLVMIAIPLVVVATGMVNMGASKRPTSLEKNIAALAINTSMYWRKPDVENPMAGNADARKDGLMHYSAMCLRCHGAPGTKPQEFASGLNPPAPMLEEAGDMFSDAELFWITKHGIRMTAMPAFGITHKEDDIWKIVEGVKALKDLSPEEKKLMKVDGNHEGHHHGAEAGDAEKEDHAHADHDS